jgi:hypothetical protein
MLRPPLRENTVTIPDHPIEHHYRATHCCEGQPVTPAHHHKTIPSCTCGWAGREESSDMSARMAWERHAVPDPIDAAIEAAITAAAEKYAHGNPDQGMFVTFTASDGYPSLRGATAAEVSTAAIRAAAPILIAAGREQVAEEIGTFANACWQVLGATKANDPILEAKVYALDEAAAIARGGTP